MNIDDYTTLQLAEAANRSDNKSVDLWGLSRSVCSDMFMRSLRISVRAPWLALISVANCGITPDHTLKLPKAEKAHRKENGSKFGKIRGSDRRRPVAFARACTVAVFPKPGGPARNVCCCAVFAPRTRSTRAFQQYCFGLLQCSHQATLKDDRLRATRC